MFVDDVTMSHDHHPWPSDSLIGNIQQNVELRNLQKMRECIHLNGKKRMEMLITFRRNRTEIPQVNLCDS